MVPSEHSTGLDAALLDALRRERQRAALGQTRADSLQHLATAAVRRSRARRARGAIATEHAGAPPRARAEVAEVLDLRESQPSPTIDAESEPLGALHRRYFQDREPAARDALVLHYHDLAVRIANRFARRGEPVEDLQQVAALALIRALDRFDPSRGVEFSTYFGRVATGELKRHFRDRTWAMRVPRSLQELHLRTKGAVEHLRGVLGRSPTIAELAHEVDATEEEVLEAMEAGSAYRLRSLDAPLRTDAPDARLEVGTLDDHFCVAEDRLARDQLLGPLLARLSDDDRELLQLYYAEGLSQGEVGDKVGMSQVAVSRRLAKIMARLRAIAEAGQS